MPKIKNIKTVLAIVFIITFIVLVTNGYAGDHFGEYLNDQTPSEYVEAKGGERLLEILCYLPYYSTWGARYGKVGEIAIQKAKVFTYVRYLQSIKHSAVFTDGCNIAMKSIPQTARNI